MGLLAIPETTGYGTLDRSAPVFTGQEWGLQHGPSKGAISSTTAVMCDHSHSQPTVVMVKAKIEKAGDSKGWGRHGHAGLMFEMKHGPRKVESVSKTYPWRLEEGNLYQAPTKNLHNIPTSLLL